MWELLQVKLFTKRTLATLNKYLKGKGLSHLLCLRSNSDLLLKKKKKSCIAFKKMFLRIYYTHLSVTAKKLCIEIAPAQIFHRRSTLENSWGRHIALIWKYISFTLFFPDEPVAEPKHVPVWEFWNGLDGNRSVNIADSKCWCAALFLMLCLEEEGLHTVMKEEWGS